MLISARKDMAKSALRIFIVAGEASGDTIGSSLMASLRAICSSPVEFSGVGGPLMEKQGLKSEFLMDDISVMGLVELLPHVFRLRARLSKTIEAAVHFQPHVVITIDAKGFSFRVLRGVREAYARLGRPHIPTVQYVAPSFWAWKGGEGNLKSLAEIVDLMLCILPFEEEVCQAHGLSATFVGHPVFEDGLFTQERFEDGGNWRISGDGDYFRRHFRISPGATVLSVLPGSRVQEVKRMLPLFDGAIQILAKSSANLSLVIPTTHSEPLLQLTRALVKKWDVPVLVLPGASDTDKYNAFAASDAGLCTSGTAVMQLMMARVPCVVAYRANLFTEWAIRARTKLKFISLPNILLGTALIPEALFASCTPKELCFQLRYLLEHKCSQEKQAEGAARVLNMLSPSSRKDAASYLKFAESRGTFSPILRPSIVAASAVLQLLGK